MKNQEEQNDKNNFSQENAGTIDLGTPLIMWNAPEYAEHDHGPLWKGVMSIIVVALIIFGIITDSIPLVIVVVLFSGVYFLIHSHKPKILDIAITDVGVKNGDKFYSFEEIQTFWIIFDPPHVKTLNLKVKKGLEKEISIQLQEQNPAEIRAFLNTQVPEWKNRTETFSEVLIRILKL